MSNVQLNLPDSILDEAKKLAAAERVPLDDYLSYVVRKHIAVRMGVDYLKLRAKGASRERFLEILNKAPDVPPMPGDEIEG